MVPTFALRPLDVLMWRWTPYSWVGDKRYCYSSSFFSDIIELRTINGVVTGDYLEGLTVVEDDPVPALTVVYKNTTASEGNSLRWQLCLSARTDGFYFSCYLIPPNGTKLTNSRCPDFLAATIILWCTSICSSTAVESRYWCSSFICQRRRGWKRGVDGLRVLRLPTRRTVDISRHRAKKYIKVLRALVVYCGNLLV